MRKALLKATSGRRGWCATLCSGQRQAFFQPQSRQKSTSLVLLLWECNQTQSIRTLIQSYWESNIKYYRRGGERDWAALFSIPSGPTATGQPASLPDSAEALPSTRGFPHSDLGGAASQHASLSSQPILQGTFGDGSVACLPWVSPLPGFLPSSRSNHLFLHPHGASCILC